MSWSDILKGPQSNTDIFDLDSFFLDTSMIPQLLSSFTNGSPAQGDVNTLDILTQYAWTSTFALSLSE